MTLLIACRCGAEYNLRDELAGRSLSCPRCGGTVRVPPPAVVSAEPGPFDRDLFLLGQRHLSLSERYVVADEAGRPLLAVERPRHLLRNLPAAVAGLLSGLVVFGFLASVGDSFSDPAAEVLFGLGGLVAGVVVWVAIYGALSRRRHATITRSGEAAPVLELRQQEKVALLTATFVLREPGGRLLATFRKPLLADLWRSRWDVFGGDGRPLLTAREDRLWKALLRRLLGPLFGILRTDFELRTMAGEMCGEVRRRFTILDRYVLDLGRDPRRVLDRRIAVALAVLLDSGQRR